ncbi:MAG: alanine glycine permease [Zetaproteobacteria bacterium]|nr:MAG: alanine glycine permease [Zetaproteobacteria bacterium]
MDIDSQIDAFFEPVAKVSSAVIFYSVPLMEGVDVKIILVWLAFAAVFFTFYLGFINIRFFGRAFKLLFGDGMKKTGDGEISQFQALMASLSGTVGLGNISGVAIAISVGGPGAVFWMTVMGFLGMSSKFAEVMLGVKYRIYPDPVNPRKVSGGPMYYLKEGFERRNLPALGSFMAGLFAVFCIIGAIGGGNMYQANQAFEQVVVATTPNGGVSMFAEFGWAFGLVLAVLVGGVILGGLKSIASVASKLVPTMAGLYVFAGLVIIGLNIDQLPSAIGIILKSAFSLDAGIGGLVGGLLIGVQRAAFSNEAALGSASIVQSTTNTDGPVGTGIVAMLGPFIDTIIICNITALVIVITGVYTQTDGSIAGVALTSMAFESVLPSFKYALTVAVMLFAYSTMISWYYCGAVCFRYIFGENDKIENIFKVFFCSCIVVGASTKLGNLIDFADAAMMSMAIPNIIGLYLFAPEIKRDVKKYVQALKK